MHKLYHLESSVTRYRRLVAGNKTSSTFWVLQELLTLLFYGFPGALGFVLRRLFYPMLFKGMSKSSTIGVNVTLRCPKSISLKSGVILDDFCQLIATTDNERGIEIGENSFVRSFASINAGPPNGYVSIGRNSTVGQMSVLYGNGGLEIGDNVMIAGHCFIVASSHSFSRKDIPMIQQGFTAKGIRIEDNVWIGAGSVILDGIKIGTGSIIASNSVVNKDIPSFSRVGGSPAKPLKRKLLND